MATLDADDLTAIRNIVREEIATTVIASPTAGSLASKVSSATEDIEDVWGWLNNGGQTDLLLDAIKAKTDLIGTGSATVSAPVAESGTISDLIIGDDYSSSNGQALSWTVDLPTGATVGGASCFFGGEHSDPSLAEDNKWLIQGTVSAGPTAGKAVILFNLLRSHTADLIPGDYNWSAEIRNDAGLQSTKVRSKKTRRVTLVKKQTIA